MITLAKRTVTLMLIMSFFACSDSKNNQKDKDDQITSTKVEKEEHKTESQHTEEQTPNTNSSGYHSSSESNLSGDVQNLNMDIQLSADELFDFDKADLKPQADKMLQELAQNLKKRGSDPVQITGFTDSKGDEEYNKKLSLRRANSVKDWLVKNGIQNEIITIGKGEAEPIAPNTDSNGNDS